MGFNRAGQHSSQARQSYTYHLTGSQGCCQHPLLTSFTHTACTCIHSSSLQAYPHCTCGWHCKAAHGNCCSPRLMQPLTKRLWCPANTWPATLSALARAMSMLPIDVCCPLQQTEAQAQAEGYAWRDMNPPSSVC